MNYTEEERKDLLTARDKIVAWCKENVIPKLKDGGVVQVSFGQRNQFNDPEYSLTVYHGRTICGTYYLDWIDISDHGGTVDHNVNTISNDDELFLIEEAVTHWKEIKIDIMATLARIQNKRNMIKNFEP